MKCQLFITLLAGVLSVSTAFAKSTDQAQTDLGYTLGYSTGQQIRQGMQRENPDLDAKAFANGVSAAIKGENSRLSAQQMQAILVNFQNDRMLKQQKQAQVAIEANRAQLVSSKHSPVDGNASGKVTLIEFFDYQCVHCRRFAPNLTKLKEDDPELRIVYKELPIFGESSNFASRAALASKKQGKYQAFHDALMKSKKPLSKENVLAIAKRVKLNITKLKQAMKSDDVIQELQNNQQLAKAIGVVGTPSLIITTTEPVKYNKDPKTTKDLVSVFIPGAPPVQMIQETISNVQSKAMGKAVTLPNVDEQAEEKGTWPGV